jgi:hypothetical protein
VPLALRRGAVVLLLLEDPVSLARVGARIDAVERDELLQGVRKPLEPGDATTALRRASRSSVLGVKQLALRTRSSGSTPSTKVLTGYVFDYLTAHGSELRVEAPRSPSAASGPLSGRSSPIAHGPGRKPGRVAGGRSGIS